MTAQSKRRVRSKLRPLPERDTRPTWEIPPAEQYAAGKAYGLTAEEMLANVTSRAKYLGERVADAVCASNTSDWQERRLGELALEAEGMRRCRLFLLDIVFGRQPA